MMNDITDRSCTKVFGRYAVVVEYYDECNSIHVECIEKGVMFTADISQLTSQCNPDNSKWLEDENEIEGAQMGARTWGRIDSWLTAESHY